MSLKKSPVSNIILGINPLEESGDKMFGLGEVKYIQNLYLDF
jgi:hypothetical protein